MSVSSLIQILVQLLGEASAFAVENIAKLIPDEWKSSELRSVVRFDNILLITVMIVVHVVFFIGNFMSKSARSISTCLHNAYYATDIQSIEHFHDSSRCFTILCP